jgi:hypothetical protein
LMMLQSNIWNLLFGPIHMNLPCTLMYNDLLTC